MSTLRISTKDPNRALSLKDYLSQHGLHVVMLSPTELEIEDGNVSEELGDEISSWRHAQDLEITVQTVAQDATQSDESIQPVEEWSDFEAPQREFVLAPHWRSAKAKLSALGSTLAAKGEATKNFFGQLSTRLHETEERILTRSAASDKERKIAEEKAWADKVQPTQSVQPAKGFQLAEKIQLRQRIHSAAAAITSVRSTRWLTDGGKAVAFAGGIVMAGLIGIGLSVSHIDKASAGTSHPGSEPASATAIKTSTQTVHQPLSSTPGSRQTAHITKLSPASAPHIATKHNASAGAVASRHEEDLAEDDGPEVVTHYYHQKAVSKLQKTTYNGVKRYSDMD